MNTSQHNAENRQIDRMPKSTIRFCSSVSLATISVKIKDLSKFAYIINVKHIRSHAVRLSFFRRQFSGQMQATRELYSSNATHR